tara:strand:- start:1297 stop:1647 length:351 start_codon:yes stop_codon:yes gene_type:complete
MNKIKNQDWIKLNKKKTCLVQLHDKNQKPTLEELQAMVGGPVQVAMDDQDLRVQIIVDEEGKLKGKPMNEEATEYWFRLLQLDTNPDEYYTYEEFVSKVDWIAGDAIVLHGGARLD